MNEDLIKTILKKKLEIINCAEKLLPESIRTNFDNFKCCFLKAVNEVTAEYSEPSPTKKHETVLKNITVD